MASTLQTARLEIRPISTDDFADLCALYADERFTRPVLPAVLNSEEVWVRVLRDIGHWRVFGHGNWTVRLRETGAFVGTVGVFHFRRSIEPRLDAPEVGWGVAPVFQRQGIALEAASAALIWCDQALKTPRTVCIIDPANRSSLALAARLGFSAFARSRYKERPIDMLERLNPDARAEPLTAPISALASA